MTKREFINLTGEEPEDFFGPDWENLMKEWEDNEINLKDQSIPPKENISKIKNYE